MKQFYTVLFSVFFITSSPSLYAQCSSSSSNPSVDAADWDWDETIEKNFNAARRWEEGNLGLTPNCLGNMAPPTVGWNNLNYDQLVLYIHNSERVARDSLPLYGVETNLDEVAQAHSEWMLENNVFSHAGDPAFGENRTYNICDPDCVNDCSSKCIEQNGSSPYKRIRSKPILNNYQWAAENIFFRSENLSNSVVASMVYGFIYQDGPGWGHRKNILRNYTNNWGDSGSEGFIGVGVYEGNNYSYCGICGASWHATLLTIDYYDPFPSPSSGYTFNTIYTDIQSAALPIEFVDFYSKKMPEQVELSWVTASEENCDYFVVQRSADMKEFEDLCDVEALRDSNDIKEYSYIDEKPLAGTNYYRLKYYDNDGRYQLSDVVSEYFEVDLAAKVFPNPFKDRFNIEGLDAADKYSIEVLDINGKVVYDLDIISGNSTLEIDLSGYDTGLYFVNIQGGYTEKTYKILKY